MIEKHRQKALQTAPASHANVFQDRPSDREWGLLCAKTGFHPHRPPPLRENDSPHAPHPAGTGPWTAGGRPLISADSTTTLPAAAPQRLPARIPRASARPVPTRLPPPMRRSRTRLPNSATACRIPYRKPSPYRSILALPGVLPCLSKSPFDPFTVDIRGRPPTAHPPKATKGGGNGARLNLLQTLKSTILSQGNPRSPSL